ncbi:MAG: tail fiber domain-containing protein [bacterium]
MKHQFVVKLYARNGTFTREITGELVAISAIKKQINGFIGDLSLTFKSKFDQDITGLDTGSIITIYDELTLLYKGIVSEIKGSLSGEQKTVTVEDFNAFELNRLFYKTGTTLENSQATKTASNWIKAIIDNYRTRCTAESETPVISYTTGSIATCSTSIARKIDEKKHFEAIADIFSFIKESYFWHITPDGVFHLQQYPSTGKYTVNFGTAIYDAGYGKSINELSNRVYVGNSKKSTEADFLFSSYNDVVSKGLFGLVENVIKDGRLTSTTTADVLGYSQLSQYSDPRYNYDRIIVTDNDKLINLEDNAVVSLWDCTIGESVNFRNRSITTQLYPDNAVILSISYTNEGTAEVTIGNLQKTLSELIFEKQNAAAERLTVTEQGAVTLPIDGSDITDGTIDAALKVNEGTITDALLRLGGSVDGVRFDKMYQGTNSLYLLNANHVRANEIIAQSACIATGVIIDAHIQTLTAAKITAGTIASKAITISGSLGYIQSSGFVTGSSGWRITGDGNAEFNGVVVRGTGVFGTVEGQRVELDSNRFRAYSATNTLIAQINSSNIDGTDTIFEAKASGNSSGGIFQNNNSTPSYPALWGQNDNTGTSSIAGYFVGAGGTMNTATGDVTGNGVVTIGNFGGGGVRCDLLATGCIRATNLSIGATAFLQGHVIFGDGANYNVDPYTDNTCYLGSSQTKRWNKINVTDCYVHGAFNMTNASGTNVKLFNLQSSSVATNPVHIESSGTNAWRVYYYTSSQKHKDNIRDLDFDASKVMRLQPRSWEDKSTGVTTFGMIAEEVAEILPELCVFNDEGEATNVNYQLISVLLLQELQKMKGKKK